jgi:hypothetical protein
MVQPANTFHRNWYLGPVVVWRGVICFGARLYVSCIISPSPSPNPQPLLQPAISHMHSPILNCRHHSHVVPHTDSSKALWHGVLELHPAVGHCAMLLNPSMSARDNEYRGRALMETMEDLRPPVLLEDLVKALEALCHPVPWHSSFSLRTSCGFMVTFWSASECTVVFKDSTVLCQGVPVRLARWHPGWGALESSKLPCLTKLSFDALPRWA